MKKTRRPNQLKLRGPRQPRIARKPRKRRIETAAERKKRRQLQEAAQSLRGSFAAPLIVNAVLRAVTAILGDFCEHLL